MTKYFLNLKTGRVANVERVPDDKYYDTTKYREITKAEKKAISKAYKEGISALEALGVDTSQVTSPTQLAKLTEKVDSGEVKPTEKEETTSGHMDGLIQVRVNGELPGSGNIWTIDPTVTQLKLTTITQVTPIGGNVTGAVVLGNEEMALNVLTFGTFKKEVTEENSPTVLVAADYPQMKNGGMQLKYQLIEATSRAEAYSAYKPAKATKIGTIKMPSGTVATTSEETDEIDEDQSGSTDLSSITSVVAETASAAKEAVEQQVEAVSAAIQTKPSYVVGAAVLVVATISGLIIWLRPRQQSNTVDSRQYLRSRKNNL